MLDYYEVTIQNRGLVAQRDHALRARVYLGSHKHTKGALRTTPPLPIAYDAPLFYPL